MTPETQSNPNELSPLKRALLALEAAQSKVAALQAAANEPVAVIGLGWFGEKHCEALSINIFVRTNVLIRLTTS